MLHVCVYEEVRGPYEEVRGYCKEKLHPSQLQRLNNWSTDIGTFPNPTKKHWTRQLAVFTPMQQHLFPYLKDVSPPIQVASSATMTVRNTR